MTIRVLMADVSGGRVLSRPRFGWMADVKVALGSRWMTVEAPAMHERLEGVESPGAYVID